MKEPLERAIKASGGIQAMADAFGITTQAIRKWLAAGQAPAERCPEIELITGRAVTCRELRPQVYPDHIFEAAPAAGEKTTISSSPCPGG